MEFIIILAVIGLLIYFLFKKIQEKNKVDSDKLLNDNLIKNEDYKTNKNEIICPYCKSEIDLTAKFCNKCGNILKLTCKNCNEENYISFKYCKNCGQKLDN